MPKERSSSNRRRRFKTFEPTTNQARIHRPYWIACAPPSRKSRLGTPACLSCRQKLTDGGSRSSQMPPMRAPLKRSRRMASRARAWLGGGTPARSRSCWISTRRAASRSPQSKERTVAEETRCTWRSGARSRSRLPPRRTRKAEPSATGTRISAGPIVDNWRSRSGYGVSADCVSTP